MCLRHQSSDLAGPEMVKIRQALRTTEGGPRYGMFEHSVAGGIDNKPVDPRERDWFGSPHQV
jgi:hypothetical protein